MDLSPLTVKTHMSRALTHIKAFLKLKGIIIGLFGLMYFGAQLVVSPKYNMVYSINSRK
jgi:hypothetical protein